ncbi:MAG TPA: FecR family protein [Burkholderiales bacterium]|nr:FecR family protein [Burkholderiales bacterium]
MRNIERSSGLLVLCALAGAVWTGQAIASTAGVFQFVAGDVRVTLAAGSERPASKGSPIGVGDTVTTAKASMAQIKMGDGAIVVVQPDSRLTVAEYRYSGKEDGTEKVQFRLEQGGIRSVTGAIGHTHKGNYMIETPIAHIGVRGTDHESWYFPSRASIDGVPAEAGLYNKVNVGLTYIQTESGEVAIAPNQVGFAASALDQPHLLGAMPEFFNRSFELRGARRGGEGIPAVAAVEANARGVNWGTWRGGLVTASNRAGNSNMPADVAAKLPATAQLAAFPPQVINATYNYASGTVGGTGSPSGTISRLSVGVNLTTQTISNYSVNATVGAQNWSGNGSGTLGNYMSSGIMLRGNCSGCVPGGGSPAAIGSATGGFVGGQSGGMTTSFGMNSATQSISGSALLTTK